MNEKISILVIFWIEAIAAVVAAGMFVIICLWIHPYFFLAIVGGFIFISISWVVLQK